MIIKVSLILQEQGIKIKDHIQEKNLEIEYYIQNS